MDSVKGVILKSYKNGATIKGLTDMLYNQMREKEKSKKTNERVKVRLEEAKNIVEQTIYEGCFRKVE